LEWLWSVANVCVVFSDLVLNFLLVCFFDIECITG